MTKKLVPSKQTSDSTAVARGGARPTTSTERARDHLERLEKSKGRRILVDLDASGAEALELLSLNGYGSTYRLIVQTALIAASKRYRTR